MHDNSVTFWVALNEDMPEGEPAWVHAMSVGNYEHPLFGKLNFTMDRIRRFADSVKNRVRGIDLYINYDHNLHPGSKGEAAGWIKDAEVRDNGLWFLVEWTKEAAQKLKDKQYRYMSSEFAKEWKDSQGKEHQDVVIGAALTNIPYLKNLVPINMNELAHEGESEDNEMDRAKLAKILGLSEESTDEEIEAKLNELAQSGGDEGFSLDKLNISVTDEGEVVVTHPDVEGEARHKAEVSSGGGSGSSKEKEEEEEKELAKLAESNPLAAKMIEEHKAMAGRVETLEAATRLSEISTQLSDLGGEQKHLPPVVQEKLRKILVRLPVQLSDDIVDAMVELVKVGFVELGERTPGKPGSGGSGNDDGPVEAFLSEVDKVIDTAKKERDEVIDYRDAVALVSQEQPKLFAEYKEAVRDGATAISLRE